MKVASHVAAVVDQRWSLATSITNSQSTSAPMPTRRKCIVPAVNCLDDALIRAGVTLSRARRNRLANCTRAGG